MTFDRGWSAIADGMPEMRPVGALLAAGYRMLRFY